MLEIKKTKIILKPRKHYRGYIIISVVNDEGYIKEPRLHRLIIETFIGKIDKNMVINHKDLNKTNNHLDNLEIITQKENVRHAYNNGVKRKHIEVSVREVKNKTIKHYKTLAECARDNNLSKSLLEYRLTKDQTRIYPDMKQYRIKSTTPWFLPENIEKALMLNGINNIILVKNLETNEVKEFNSQALLAKELKVSEATITGWLKLMNQPVLPGFIQMQYKALFKPWRPVKDMYEELRSFNTSRTVIVYNDEVKLIFDSAISCAGTLKIKPTALNYRLKSKGTKVFKDGFRYSYYSDYKDIRSA